MTIKHLFSLINKDKEIKAPEVDLFGEVDIELKENTIIANKSKKAKERKAKKLKLIEDKALRLKEAKEAKRLREDNETPQERAARLAKEVEAAKAVADKIAEKARPKKEKAKLINKNLLKLARVKLNSIQSKEAMELKALNISVTEKDLLQIMTLLALSWSQDGDLAKEDIHLFFDDQCNFLHEAEFLNQDGPNAPMKWVDDKTSKMIPYDPFSCLYKWFLYIDYEVLNKHSDGLSEPRYLNSELNDKEIYNFQVEIFISLFDGIDSCGGEFSDDEEWRYGLPIKAKKIQKLLNIGEAIYPKEFTEILKACTYFVDDRNGPHIEAEDNNGVLLLKVNHRTNASTDIMNDYIREEVIENFLYGGLIMQALGTFTGKAPKILHQFLGHNPTIMGSARITSGMRWSDPRTIKKTRTDKSNPNKFRETSEEYSNRHDQLAYAWNDGLFGSFKIEVQAKYFALEWEYPKFFKIDPIENIENDGESIIGDLLDPSEGNRYPFIPYDLQKLDKEGLTNDQ